VVDLASFKARSYIGLEDFTPGTLGFTRDEALLAVVCQPNRRLFFINPADGTVVARVEGLRESPGRPLLTADNARLLLPHGAPGGTAVVDLRRRAGRIAFASNRAGESYQLYTMDGDGKRVERLTNNHYVDRWPRWSPDGRWIAFVSDRDGQPRIYVTPWDRDDAVPLLATDPAVDEPGAGATLDWSPDGTEIVFIGKWFRALRVVNLESGAIRTLFAGEAAPGLAQYASVCWQRDGPILFTARPTASAHHREIFRIDPKTAKVVQITQDRGSPEHYAAPSMSPDGKRIAVARYASRDPPLPGPIRLLNADGSEQARLESTAATLNLAPRWSADGKAIAYIVQAGAFRHLWMASVEGETTSPLSAGNWHDVDPDVWGDAPSSVVSDAPATKHQPRPVP
jgi:dipeptidyl aminopeptidase/acylaminoacyl peptidase